MANTMALDKANKDLPIGKDGASKKKTTSLA